MQKKVPHSKAAEKWVRHLQCIIPCQLMNKIYNAAKLPRLFLKKKKEKKCQGAHNTSATNIVFSFKKNLVNPGYQISRQPFSIKFAALYINEMGQLKCHSHYVLNKIFNECM